MDRNEILEYHRSYNWHAYAGLSFSTLFIVVPLFLDGKLTDRTPVEYFAIIFGLALLAVATVILGVIDFVHTNTLTPLVTTKRRFQIIHWVIVFGGAALALQICAVGVFLSLINPWLSIVSTIVALGLMAFLSEVRAIPAADIQIERGLTDEQIEQVYQRSNRRR